MTIQQLKLGDSASHSKTISETDVYLFAGITGDLNPPMSTSPWPVPPGSADGLPTASSAPASFPPSWPCSCPAPAPSTWARS